MEYGTDRLTRTAARDAGGMALVLVLAILVLLTGLVVALMTLGRTELATSQSYADGTRVRQLAESGVQTVIAQITQATRGYSDPADPAGSALTWASQPGAIRTYNTAGTADQVYKLYSSPVMRADGATFSATAEAPPIGWASEPGLYTDLNQPALVADANGTITPDPASGARFNAQYPIVDPSGVGRVEGFAIQGAPTTYNGSYPPAASYDPVADANPLPMPAHWLYILQDGSLIAPSGSVSGLVSFDPARSPSAANPIVGRIAFWTDDESSKLNINTASEGTFYDVPRGSIRSEIDLARAMPVRDEFQRTPGHPAMTALSPALGWVLPRPFPVASGNYSQLTAYYDLAPRVNYTSNYSGNGTDWTSQGGSRPTMTSNVNEVVLALDGNRLYASLDELVFSPARTLNHAALTRDAVERSKFFLTASSRAPETNLFNQPRIGLWPIQVNPSKRDAKDKLIEFCTRVGGNPYYFQRFSEGPGNFAALDAWTGADPTQIPSALSQTVDFNQITRNQQLYQYLQNRTATAIPGFGSSFVQKWSALGRDRVLTNLFDVIRSGLSTMPSGLTGGYHYATERDASRRNGERFVVPIQIDAGNGVTKGFGRFSTVTQAAIVFYATKTVKDLSGNPNAPPLTTEMQAVIMFQPFQPTPGMFNWAPICRYDVDFGGGFSITTGAGTGSFPGQAVNRLTKDAGAGTDGGEILALGGIARAFKVADGYGGVAGVYKILDPNEDKGYPFFTAKVPVPAGANATFNFGGGTLTLKIRSGIGTPATKTNGEVFQAIRMTFPDLTNLPVPQGMSGSLSTPPADGTPISVEYDSRIQAGNARDSLIQDGDIVRSVQATAGDPVRGDFRLIAGLAEVPASYFVPHPDYFATVNRYTDSRGTQTSPGAETQNAAWAAARLGRFATSLRSTSFRDYQFGIGSGAPGSGNYEDRNNMNNGLGGLQVLNVWGVRFRQSSASTVAGSLGGIPQAGGLVAGISYANNDTPVAAQGTTSALMTNGNPGDWDSGSGFSPDGPYINKPDPGNLNAGDGTGGYYTDTTSNNNAIASHSPNRQVASAVLFGSLPTPLAAAGSGLQPGDIRPWQTLLFCANPSSKGSTPADHPGFGTPKDHLLLDLFTMPIVEPYAISEPLSTAGKVNLNYRILPFDYVRRSTAVRGVLKPVLLGAIPNNATTANASRRYKIADPSSGSIPVLQTRYLLNLDETTGTLRGFEDRFAAGELFRSASEICEIFLVPADAGNATYGSIPTWWDGYKLTGDNLRESPYNQIYPRVTTKSNTYTVHYRVQVLRKSPAAAGIPSNVWAEGREPVVAESRGSTLIERYVDAADPNLPDFITATGGNLTKYPVAAIRNNLDTYYKFRVLAAKRFDP